MKFIQITALALGWACFGTIVVEAGAAGALWMKGRLNTQKISEIVAVMYGVDSDSIQQELERVRQPLDSEQPSYDQITRARSISRLELDLREMAVDKAIVDGKFLEAKLEESRNRHVDLRSVFNSTLNNLNNAANDEALLAVQGTLISLPAKQAKDQILRLMDTEDQSEQSMNDVIAIVKSMPLDKRKKIFAEFKERPDQEQLSKILMAIRQGVPSVNLIRQTRQQLRRFDPSNTEGNMNDNTSR